MKLTLIAIAYGAILLISWEIQKVHLLLGYTLGVFGVLGVTVWLIDYLARRYV